MFIDIFKFDVNKCCYFIAVNDIFKKSAALIQARARDRPQNLHGSITYFENGALALVLATKAGGRPGGGPRDTLIHILT